MAYLLDVWLEGTIEGPRLHVLRDQALLPEDVQSKTLLHWAQVWVRDPANLCHREKSKKLWVLSEQEMVGRPWGLEMPLTPLAPIYFFWSSHLTLCRGNLAVHGLQA